MKRWLRWILPALFVAVGIGPGFFALPLEAQKLVTGSEFDVQFRDLKKQYAFGLAIFDNAQVRHAYTPGALKLTFE